MIILGGGGCCCTSTNVTRSVVGIVGSVLNVAVVDDFITVVNGCGR